MSVAASLDMSECFDRAAGQYALDADMDPETPWRCERVDVLTFAREFLGRTHSPKQEEALAAIWGDDPSVFWPTEKNLYALCWGMGSGKNMVMETNVAYADYSLMCLRSPQQHFWGIAEPRFIDILNFSFVNEKQAKDIFFDSVKNVLRACRNPDTGGRWFEERGVDLRDNGIGDIKTKIISLPGGIRNRCIVASREGFEGSNILMGVFDEPSRAVYHPWKNEQAHTLLEKVRLNTTTRFASVGKVVLFSYPEAEEDDLIMETVRRAEAGEKGVWASVAPTYEVNPLREYKDFDEFRESDPDRYETIIECHPPASRTGWYRSHPEKIDDTFREDIAPVVEIGTRVVEREVPGADGETARRKFTEAFIRKIKGDKEPRALGGDPGKSGDSFALALCRAEKAASVLELVMEEDVPGDPVVEPVSGRPVEVVGDDGTRRPITPESRKVEKRLARRTLNVRPVVDAIIEIKPIVERRKGSKSHAYPIDFTSVKDCLLKIKQHFPGLRVAKFDHWNSASLVHELVRAGIAAEDLAFSNALQLRLYRQHRSLVYADWIAHTARGPKAADGRPKALVEFHELQDFGHRVDHKAGGSKDASDAVVLAADGILDHRNRRSARALI